MSETRYQNPPIPQGRQPNGEGLKFTTPLSLAEDIDNKAAIAAAEVQLPPTPLMKRIPEMKIIFDRLLRNVLNKSIDGFKEDYCCYIDTETTGLKPMENRVWQFACIICLGPEIVDERNWIIKITRDDFNNAFGGDAVPLDKRQELYKKMHLTWDRIVESGKPGKQVLDEFVNLINGRPMMPILGHNLAGFDVPFLTEEARRCGMYDQVSKIFKRATLDTGAIIKGAQLHGSLQMLDRMSGQEFMKKVIGKMARGVYWRMDYIMEQFRLFEKEADISALHDALEDVKALKRIIEFIVDYEV